MADLVVDERPATTDRPVRRVLVGGVGYTNLRDMSLGPILIERLGHETWPAGVDVEDLSAGAIHVLHALQDRPAYDAAVLVAAVRRGGTPGAVRRIAWDHPRQSTDDVQIRVGEALTGIIGIDTLLTVLDHFEALPADTTVIEVEPLVEEWGTELSEHVTLAADVAAALVRDTVAGAVA